MPMTKPPKPAAGQRETFRAWLDRKSLTIDAFIRALPAFDGVPVVSTSTANKWASTKARPEHVHPATRLLLKQRFPDCPLA